VGTKARGWGMGKKTHKGLQEALRAVESLQRREWDPDDADSPEARSARAYNSGLAMSARAIRREMQP